MSTQLGLRGSKIAAFGKYALVVAVGLVVSFVVFQAIAGLIGLGIVVGIVLFTQAASPWLSFKLTNFVMNRFIAEVYANPVTSRMQVEMKMKGRIDEEEVSLKEQNAATTAFSAQVEKLKRDFPEDAKRFDDMLKAFEQLLTDGYNAWEVSKKELEKYKAQTRRVSAIWEVTQTGNKLAKLAQGRAQEQAWMQIASDTSIKAADESLAEAMARMDHIRRKREAGENNPMLTNTPSQALPTAVTQLQKVEVVR